MKRVSFGINNSITTKLSEPDTAYAFFESTVCKSCFKYYIFYCVSRAAIIFKGRLISGATLLSLGPFLSGLDDRKEKD